MNNKGKDVFGRLYNESDDGFPFFVPLFPFLIKWNI